jgi:hypothetical protein
MRHSVTPEIDLVLINGGPKPDRPEHVRRVPVLRLASAICSIRRHEINLPLIM